MNVEPKLWIDDAGVKTTPVKCLLCEADAAIIGYFPFGCTCSPNKIQPRCMQHFLRANDTEESFEIIEDFRMWKGEYGHER